LPTDTPASPSSSDIAPAEAPALERRLAAILAADVAGYSRLMHDDDEKTLATLTAHRKIIDQLIVGANGQIFNTAGDSVLAEFPSVVEAYHAAVAIQRALGRANAEIPEASRMEMRIGINVGDVMAKDGEIFGEGVNIASRLESLAEAGAICVSRTARDQLRDRVDMNFADLGEHSVKNISRPVRAFRVIFDRNAEPELPDSVRRSEAEADASESEETPDSDSVEIAFWQSVQASDDDAEYRLYLERYAKGAFAELARTRLRSASAVDDTDVELLFWETVRDGNDAAMLRAYLEKYPDGKFRSLADIMLAKLDNKS
jgi:class 3 adenylate cyclase